MPEPLQNSVKELSSKASSPPLPGLLDGPIGQVELGPLLSLAYGDRGNAYKILGEFERAILAYDEAIRLDSGFASAYANRAIAFAELGKDAKTSDDIEKVALLGFLLDVVEAAVRRTRGKK